MQTDITVLTDQRVYHFDYVGIEHEPDDSHADLLYALRFLYPTQMVAVLSATRQPVAVAAGALADADRVRSLLASAAAQAPRNIDYWYCGARVLQPAAAWG